MNNESFEINLIKMNQEEINNYLFQEGFIHREQICEGSCKQQLKYVKCSTFTEQYCWRCSLAGCSKFQQRTSIRKNSFFENFSIDCKTVFKILLRWSCKQQQHSILQSINVSKPTFRKIKEKLNEKMKVANENGRKLGGPGTIVQADETMMNFKCKSHRGRSPENRTDALCIVECNPKITRCWAEIIEDKRATTIIPILFNRVVPGSTVHTDEHKSYKALSRVGFVHSSVCHKFCFVDRETGIHTQHVESFNNALKFEIKIQKGVKTEKRGDFLTEFIWKWNNKENLFDAVLNLIKL